MNRVLNFYTHWVFVLSLLEKYTKINVYPSVVFCLIGSTILSFYFNVKTNTKIMLFLFHLLPFLWTIKDLSKTTFVKNIYIGIAYILFLFLQNITVYQVYKEQFLFFKKYPNLLINHLITGKTNMCLFC